MRVPSPRVLVADDQTDIQQALRLLLSEAGFETELVGSVEGVIDRLSAREYDLLLMDLNYTRDTTSGREGLELIDRIRARDHGLPIVVMTGWGSIETAVEAMRRGARSFVQKPWDDTTLVDIVGREIEDGQAARRRDARLAREQSEARLIQRALLPAALPVTPRCTLAAQWTPASGIGGDCYDVIRFSEARLAVSIADVAGKGLPAALLMSNLQAAVRAFATDGAEPHAVCGSVNRLLCRNIAPGRFVTFCYAVMDFDAGTVAYANAGHNPPLVARANGTLDRLAPTGIVLGVAHDWTYTTGETHLSRGDRLVWFTDGVTEAMSPDGDEFGDDRLGALVRRHVDAPAEALLAQVSRAVQAWTGGAGSQDDATLIVAAIG